MNDPITVVYGSFGKRLLALLIDGLILAPIIVPLQWLDKTSWKDPYLMVFIYLLGMLFRPFFELLYSASPGKMIMKLKVVQHDLSRVTLSNVILRNALSFLIGIVGLYFTLQIFKLPEFQFVATMKEYSLLTRHFLFPRIIQTLLTLLIYILEIVLLSTDSKKRALHDRFGGTLVIEKR